MFIYSFILFVYDHRRSKGVFQDMFLALNQLRRRAKLRTLSGHSHSCNVLRRLTSDCSGKKEKKISKGSKKIREGK